MPKSQSPPSDRVPGAYRRLGPASFAMTLPAWFRHREVLAYLGRDPKSRSERLDGGTYAFAFRYRGLPLSVSAEVADGQVRTRLEADGPLPPGAARAAHGRLRRVLGLVIDPRPFERQVLADPATARLVAGRRGLSVPQTPDAWDGLVWVIAGQQVCLAVAFAQRRRLAALAGTPAPGGLIAPPDAAAVARLEVGDLRSCSFSTRKAEYLLALARAVTAGELDLEGLARRPAAEIEERLLARRGLGIWSARYLMMRTFGLADCVPIGDAGLTRALARFHRLDHRPDAAETAELMRPYAPFRSLATFQLWASLHESADPDLSGSRSRPGRR